ncbi:MAG: lipid-binding SYLF domain-containing protein [Desulfobulbaceae bacterium]
MDRTIRSFLAGITAFLIFLSLPCISRSADFTRPDELVIKSEAVLKSFLADPNMQWLRSNLHQAQGIFIVPQMVRGGFFIGGSGGSGALLAKNFKTGQWSFPAFYTMGSVSLGLQIGADVSEIVLLVMSSKGMKAMLTTEFKLGADIAIAAGPVGASAKAQLADIVAFGRAKGAFVGLAVDGAVIAPRYEWNTLYYGRDVLLGDILVNQSVTNPQADGLRGALPRDERNAKPLGR